jgi:hypothetical protein
MNYMIVSNFMALMYSMTDVLDDCQLLYIDILSDWHIHD